MPLRPSGFASQASGTSQLSSSADARSFSSAVGKALTDKDYERYIDPEVTGHDRVLVTHFMKIMPSNKRGDLVYIRSDGSVLSNRLAFRATTVRQKIYPNDLSYPDSHSGIRPLSFPPATFSGSGAYIREYSVLGVTAAEANVYVPCADAMFKTNAFGYTDVGYLYLGGFGSVDSQIDAGLQYNNDESIQPFVATSFNASPVSWTNQGQKYQCGSQLAELFGPLPAPSAQMFLAVGIPVLVAQGATPLPSEDWSSGAWVFFDKPSDYYSPGTDANGLSTVCTGCIAKRMTSIAQKGGDDFSDNSCFGGCNSTGDASIAWTQITMGQIISPCESAGLNQVECTIQYYASGDWYGGWQQYPEPPSSVFHVAIETSNSAQEGIFLDPPPAYTVQNFSAKACPPSQFGALTYYPGQTDWAGNTVPAGIEEIWHITENKNCPDSKESLK